MYTWTAFSALLGLYLIAACTALVLVAYFMALTERRTGLAQVRADLLARRRAARHRRAVLSSHRGTTVRGTAPAPDRGRYPIPPTCRCRAA